MAGAQMLAKAEKEKEQPRKEQQAGFKPIQPATSEIAGMEARVFDRITSEREPGTQEAGTLGSVVSLVTKIPVIGWIVGGISFLVNAVRNTRREIEEKKEDAGAAALVKGVAATVYNSTVGAAVNFYHSIFGRMFERKREGEEIGDEEYRERLRKIERHIFDNNFSTALAELRRVGERKLAPERAAKIADITDEVEYLRASRSVFNIFFGIPKRAAGNAIAEKVSKSAGRLEELSSKTAFSDEEKTERAYLTEYLKRKTRSDALYALDSDSRGRVLAALGKQASSA